MLNSEEQEIVIKLFKEFEIIFAKHNTYIGLAKDVLYKIDLVDAPTFKSRAIKYCYAAKVVTEAEIQKLLNIGLLLYSYSLWVSPLLILRKKIRYKPSCY